MSMCLKPILDTTIRQEDLFNLTLDQVQKQYPYVGILSEEHIPFIFKYVFLYNRNLRLLNQQVSELCEITKHGEDLNKAYRLEVDVANVFSRLLHRHWRSACSVMRKFDPVDLKTFFCVHSTLQKLDMCLELEEVPQLSGCRPEDVPEKAMQAMRHRAKKIKENTLTYSRREGIYKGENANKIYRDLIRHAWYRSSQIHYEPTGKKSRS